MSLCDAYQAKISYAIRSFFMCEKFPSLLYLLAFFPDTLRSWQQVCLSLRSMCKVSQKCHHKCHGSVREKGTVTKAESLFVRSLEISSKKSPHWKMPRNFATKIQWPEVGQIPRVGGGTLTLAIWVCCTSVAQKSMVFQSNLYYKTIIRFSPSLRKTFNIST